MVDVLQQSILELIRRTSVDLPDDVRAAIVAGRKAEKEETVAASTMQTIERNIDLARQKCGPICQDTGSVLLYVNAPGGFDAIAFEGAACNCVKRATEMGWLRPNSVDPITGRNSGTNIGPGNPTFHFEQSCDQRVEVRLVLKGGGCENVGAQYSLPDERIGADRSLAGCRKAVLDAVLQAQGKGCAPGVLGVCIGGDRATGYAHSKRQFLRRLDDANPDATLDAFEKELLHSANTLGIGPMGFGGRTTLLSVKACALNRVPASFFVTVSYMCWAYRRQGVMLDADGRIAKWLY